MKYLTFDKRLYKTLPQTGLFLIKMAEKFLIKISFSNVLNKVSHTKLLIRTTDVK